MPTSNLGVPTLVAAQANKIVFINEAFEAFDQATQGVATYDAEDGDLTLTVEQFSAAYLLDFTGSPGADRNITLPANVRRSFGVRNSTGRPLTLQLDSVTDSGVEIADGAVAAFVSTTTELLRIAGGGGGDGITPAQVARLLPTFPDAGSRDDLIPKFDGDTLGWEADATGGGGAAITVEDEGTALATDAETLNFTGAGVTVTNDGTTASKKVINIPAATAGDGGLTAVETDATLTGDGTSGNALGIADGGVDTTQLANDAVTVDKVEDALLARVPASALPAPSNANNGKVVGLTATAYAAVDAPAGGASLIIADETTDLATPATRIQFQGAGVTAANDGTTAATKVVTIPGASGTGGYTPAVSDKTADYTVVNGDQGNTVRATGSTALTFTLPDVATPIAAGWWVRVANASSAALTIDGNGADTIDGEATLEVAAGDVVTLQVVGATAWMVLTTTAGGAGTGSGGSVTELYTDSADHTWDHDGFRTVTLSATPTTGRTIRISLVSSMREMTVSTTLSSREFLELPIFDADESGYRPDWPSSGNSVWVGVVVRISDAGVVTFTIGGTEWSHLSFVMVRRVANNMMGILFTNDGSDEAGRVTVEEF